jgi:hypothetical protein
MAPTDQPSGVKTKDAPRPPDNVVVTDENQASGQEAAAAVRKDGTKTPKSADGIPPTDDDANQPSRRDRHAEKRIKRLSRQLAAERDRNTSNDQRIAKLEQELKALKTSGAARPPKEPEPKEFKDPKDYAKAYAKWERETEAAKKATDVGADDDAGKDRKGKGKGGTGDDDAAAREERPDTEDLERFFKAGKKKLGDEFLMAQEAAAAQEFAVNRTMGDFILDSEFGPEIFVYLSEHPKESRRIYDKSDPKAIAMLEALEEQAKAGTLLDDEDEDEDEDDDRPQGRDRGGRFKRRGEADDERRDGVETRGEGERMEAGKSGTRAPTPPNQSGKDRGGSRARVDLESAGMDDYAAERHRQEKERLQRH